MSRYIGLMICLLIIIGAISHVGFNIYKDILSFHLLRVDVLVTDY